LSVRGASASVADATLKTLRRQLAHSLDRPPAIRRIEAGCAGEGDQTPRPRISNQRELQNGDLLLLRRTRFMHTVIPEKPNK